MNTEKCFISGIFFCWNEGYIDEEEFWNLIEEAGFNKTKVEKMAISSLGETIKEMMER